MDVKDIDALLDEVEEGFNAATKCSKTLRGAATGSGSSESSSRTTTTEDLDLLLTDLPETCTTHTIDASSSTTAASDKKCWPPYLTGASGCTSATPCRHLRCVKCDCAVISFDGWQWSDDVTYLFLRNNYPNVDKLRAKLQPRRTCRAYACQCRNVSTTGPVALTSSGDNTWVCTGKL